MGDILSIDVGVRLDGWCSDSAWTFPVGEVSEAIRHLLKVTDKKPGVDRPFEKVKENIRTTLMEKKTTQAMKAYVQTLKKQADLKTYF